MSEQPSDKVNEIIKEIVAMPAPEGVNAELGNETRSRPVAFTHKLFEIDDFRRGFLQIITSSKHIDRKVYVDRSKHRTVEIGNVMTLLSKRKLEVEFIQEEDPDTRRKKLFTIQRKLPVDKVNVSVCEDLVNIVNSEEWNKEKKKQLIIDINNKIGCPQAVMTACYLKFSSDEFLNLFTDKGKLNTIYPNPVYPFANISTLVDQGDFSIFYNSVSRAVFKNNRIELATIILAKAYGMIDLDGRTNINLKSDYIRFDGAGKFFEVAGISSTRRVAVLKLQFLDAYIENYARSKKIILSQDDLLSIPRLVTTNIWACYWRQERILGLLKNSDLNHVKEVLIEMREQ